MVTATTPDASTNPEGTEAAEVMVEVMAVVEAEGDVGAISRTQTWWDKRFREEHKLQRLMLSNMAPLWYITWLSLGLCGKMYQRLWVSKISHKTKRVPSCSTLINKHKQGRWPSQEELVL